MRRVLWTPASAGVTRGAFGTNEAKGQWSVVSGRFEDGCAKQSQFTQRENAG